MMATAAVIGLSAGKRILSSSFYSSDLAEKLFPVVDHGSAHFSPAATKSIIFAKRSSDFAANVPTTRHTTQVNALKEHLDTPPSTTTTTSFEDDDPEPESSLEMFLLLQKSMLEKQWKLTFDHMRTAVTPGEESKKTDVVRSGISAREKRLSTRKRCVVQTALMDRGKELRATVSPELVLTGLTGYVRGTVSENLLSHAEVVHLSKKIKSGLSLEEHKAK